MERITRDQMLMEIAQAVAKRGTCSRAQVGAVFSKDGRVISTGYNGAPKGLPHCVHFEWDGRGIAPEWLRAMPLTRAEDEVLDWVVDGPHNLYWNGKTLLASEEAPGCTIVEHAERNGIAFAARYGLALEHSELHTTHLPCPDCARSIINAGVERVVYNHGYRIVEGQQLLESAGIKVVQFPSIDDI